MRTLNDVNDLSASRGFDFWQSTERLHCTGATLLLLLRATCPFNEVEAASSKEILRLRGGGGLFGTLRSEGGDGRENVAQKVNSRSFHLHLDYSKSLTLSNVDEPS